jgi:hypothetical protein
VIICWVWQITNRAVVTEENNARRLAHERILMSEPSAPLYTVERRYATDPVFRTLVDTLQHCLESLAVTPSEVREALLLALYKVEERRTRRTIFASKDMERFFDQHG